MCLGDQAYQSPFFRNHIFLLDVINSAETLGLMCSCRLVFSHFDGASANIPLQMKISKGVSKVDTDVDWWLESVRRKQIRKLINDGWLMAICRSSTWLTDPHGTRTSRKLLNVARFVHSGTTKLNFD